MEGSGRTSKLRGQEGRGSGGVRKDEEVEGSGRTRKWRMKYEKKERVRMKN